MTPMTKDRVLEAPVETAPAPAPAAAPSPARDETAIAAAIALQNQLKGGASWFFWIVALSVINSLIVLFQGQWTFAIGLGITQVIDEIGLALADGAGNPGAIMAGAFVMDLLAASVFVLFGVFARQRKSWAFITGMALYAIDGLIFLVAGDVLSVGFHVFGLWGIFGGLRACRAINAAEKRPVAPSATAA